MPDPAKPPPQQQQPSAVAVRYDEARESAPRVLAKGKGTVAERILAVAREHNIPLHEDRDLVHLLMVLDLDVEIPPHLYRALAEVLAHVYRVNGKARNAAR
jgi:flagellar biosynthesis protein